LGQRIRLARLSHGLGDSMSDLDSEQNRRIRDVESRINEVENQMAAILAKLEQATTLLKVVGIALGAMIGIDVQGMVV
jgi:phosphopantetheine adenylyltransferase